MCDPARSWRSPDRRLLRAAPPAGGVFDRSSGLRHDLWRPLSRPATDTASLPHPRRHGAPGAASSAASSKAAACAAPDAFHRRVLPPPVTQTLARLRMGSRGTRHRCRCSRAGGFRHRDPASGAASPAELSRLGGGASRLDPDLSIRTERRSSTSATNTNREHDRSPPDPRPCDESNAGVRLRAPPASPSGVPPPQDRTERRDRSLAGRPILAPDTGSTLDPQRGACAPRRAILDRT